MKPTLPGASKRARWFRRDDPWIPRAADLPPEGDARAWPGLAGVENNPRWKAEGRTNMDPVFGIPPLLRIRILFRRGARQGGMRAGARFLP